MAGSVLSGPATPYRSRVRRQNMKVRISTTEDTIVMKFLRPNTDTKLEGYILGYGGSMFSKQFIQLPQSGKPYETEFDAEPKYLIAVQPVPANEVKKQCTGKVELQKPLHLVIGTVTPSSVLLSWGTLLKTPYEGNVMSDCLEDGHYTVRYREKNRKWNYQTCPTSDTVIDNLKPNTVYEFGVQPTSKDGSGIWTKPVLHNISMPSADEKSIRKNLKRPVSPPKPSTPDSHSFPFSPQHVPQNRTRGRQPASPHTFPQATLAATVRATQEVLPTRGPRLPVVNERPIGGELSRSVLVPLTTQTPPLPRITTTVAKLDTNWRRLKPQSQPNSESRPEHRPPQSRPKPLQRPQRPPSQSPVRPRATPQPEIQTKPPTQRRAMTELKLQNRPPSQPPPQPDSEAKARLQPEPTPPPTPRTEPPAPVQPAPHVEIPTLKPRHKPQVQEEPPNIHPQPQPRPQPKTPQAPPKSSLLTYKPRLDLTRSESTARPQPQPPPNQQPDPPKKTRIRNSQRRQPRPALKPTSEAKSQPGPLPRRPLVPRTQPLVPRSQPLVPRPQPRPQPRTRTHVHHPKVTPKTAFPTAPSAPEVGGPLPIPALAKERAGSFPHGSGFVRPSSSADPRRNATLHRGRGSPHSSSQDVKKHSQSKAASSHASNTPGVLPPAVPDNKRPNLVGKPSDHDKPMDLKQGDKESILKPFPVVTAKPKQERRQQTSTPAPVVNSTRFDINDNSSIFRPLPASEVDIMGRKRFVAPHVIYKTDKKPDEPCSITASMAYFPDEEGSDQNVTGPPRTPPSNLTVVTVEGCPSFVILDWEKSDNETTEYEVISTTTGPNGQEISILTTNQTHTAVENLTPNSSYEFKVTPKNELGSGPTSDPVTFSTESADPRVSEHASGKDAIWTQFSFKADSYSECNGRQFVKRTWYRKFVGIQLCNSLRYKIYLSDSLAGKFYNIGDQTGYGEDHCQFVDSFLDGRTGTKMMADQLPSRPGFFRAMRQEPVFFGEIGGKSHVTYVGWYECGTPIPGKW
ncbi:target of Nesh-SH3-like [Cololabis saira]|uniref:target of Nesh-SH3-like n=1 Tax=Cololabis saira TaxID=129043 RepID=UPI002AD3ABB3|nr:target of Nesh-SH3-like [Cololabis saira]